MTEPAAQTAPPAPEAAPAGAGGEADIDVTVTAPEGDDAAEQAFVDELEGAAPKTKDEPAAEAEKPAELTSKKLLRWQEKTRRERAEVREKASKVAAREAELTARETRHAADLELAKLFRDDPLAALEKAGRSYNDLTAGVLARQKPLTQEQLDKRLAEEAATREKTATEQSAQRQAAEVKSAELGFAQFADSQAETYPAIQGWAEAHGGRAVISDVHRVAAAFRQSGQPITYEAIAAKLESDYRSRVETVSRRLGTGQPQSANGSSARKTEPVTQAKPVAPRAQSTKTLTSTQAGERAGGRRFNDDDAQEEFEREFANIA